MEKYINELGKECYKGASVDDVFDALLFHEVPKSSKYDEDHQVAFHSNLGSLTILDRITGYGYGIRDTETGFRDMNNNFWLASGMMDVRYSGARTLGEAIEWVKSHANTCTPEIKEV